MTISSLFLSTGTKSLLGSGPADQDQLPERSNPVKKFANKFKTLALKLGGTSAPKDDKSIDLEHLQRTYDTFNILACDKLAKLGHRRSRFLIFTDRDILFMAPHTRRVGRAFLKFKIAYENCRIIHNSESSALRLEVVHNSVVKRIEHIIPDDRADFNHKCHNAFSACRRRKEANKRKTITLFKRGLADMITTVVGMGFQRAEVEFHLRYLLQHSREPSVGLLMGAIAKNKAKAFPYMSADRGFEIGSDHVQQVRALRAMGSPWEQLQLSDDLLHGLSHKTKSNGAGRTRASRATKA